MSVYRDNLGLVRTVWFVAGVLSLVVLLVVGVVAGVNAYTARKCDQLAQEMGRAHHYGLVKGCLVRTDDGSYVPLDNYRLTRQEQGQ